MTSVGKQRAFWHTHWILMLAIALVAIPSTAQEPSAPPPYLFMVESKVAPVDAGDWAEAVALMAKAHGKHPQGNMWASYRRLTGGPEETVRTFFALSKMADLDSWQSNRKIVTETLGKDRARVVLSDLDLASGSIESILSYSDKLSRPAEQFRATNFAWAIEVRVEEGKMDEFAALAARLVRAYEGVEGNRWWVYGNAIGGDSSTLYFFHGFDTFAEIDGWPSRLEVLSQTMGEADASRLVAAMDAISETTSDVWQLEASLSQLEPK